MKDRIALAQERLDDATAAEENVGDCECHLSWADLGLTSTELGLLLEKNRQKLKHISSINLRGNKLTELPVEVAYLDKLTELDLSGNGLREFPDQIGGLVQLETLILIDNNIKKIPPTIGGLQQLRSLFLGKNQLSELASEMQSLQKLEELGLENNHFESIPKVLMDMHKLKDINLLGNHIPDFGGQLNGLPNEFRKYFLKPVSSKTKGDFSGKKVILPLWYVKKYGRQTGSEPLECPTKIRSTHRGVAKWINLSVGKQRWCGYKGSGLAYVIKRIRGRVGGAPSFLSPGTGRIGIASMPVPSAAAPNDARAFLSGRDHFDLNRRKKRTRRGALVFGAVPYKTSKNNRGRRI